jgi:Ca2+-transporting ATPase
MGDTLPHDRVMEMLGALCADTAAARAAAAALSECCMQVRVIRSGAELTISCFDLLVGDVLLVESGDILPADGLLYAGGPIK